jgi:uncharacterized protein (DUF983 family)
MYRSKRLKRQQQKHKLKFSPEAEPFSAKKVWRYLRRSARLRCPMCGISPLFLPARRTESLIDWFEMLPGCPRCDYAYEREPGYFLFALWLINFGLVTFFGVGLLLLLDFFFELSTAQLIFFVLVPLWLLGILTVRHVKAFFLAFDHLVHPQLEETDEPPN